jgi:hypothetical protein
LKSDTTSELSSFYNRTQYERPFTDHELNVLERKRGSTFWVEHHDEASSLGVSSIIIIIIIVIIYPKE